MDWYARLGAYLITQEDIYMYGTIARLIVKPGQTAALKKHMESVAAHPASGFVSASLYQMDKDSNVFYLAVMFKNKETYVVNANQPETNADFEKMMQYLVAEPEWHDGEISHYT